MNLDLVAQQKAQLIVRACVTTAAGDKAANELENVITKTLGVLQESGVYAAALYLWTRTRQEDKAKAEKIRVVLLNSAKELLGVNDPTAQPGEALKFLSDRICSDLDLLLLVKQVWEQTLVYARFGAKAEKASS